MSTQSDVGIAIKKEGIEELELNHPEAIKAIRDLSHDILGESVGTLYVMQGIKWNESISQVVTILSGLRNLPDDWYRLVECYYAAESISSDSSLGTWDDNPWNLRLTVRVELWYEG